MNATYTVTVTKAQGGLFAQVLDGTTVRYQSELQPSRDAAILDALRLLGDEEPEADAEVVE